MAYRLVGTKVLNGKGDIVGRVSDVVLDASGNATAVVIGIGGVAGYGDKLVAVPFKAVYIGDVTHSSRIVVLDAAEEQLQGAPTYDAKDPTATARLKAKASDWAKAAKEKAIELGNAAAEKAKEMKDSATTPSTTPPSPPSPPPSRSKVLSFLNNPARGRSPGAGFGLPAITVSSSLHCIRGMRRNNSRLCCEYPTRPERETLDVSQPAG